MQLRSVWPLVLSLVASGCGSSSDDVAPLSSDTGTALDTAVADSAVTTDTGTATDTNVPVDGAGDSLSDATDAGSCGVTNAGWTVCAAKPARLPDGTVQGSMTFARVDGAATRGGGVCLVADLNGAHPCTTAADCAPLTLPMGGFHYCAGIDGAATKTCWTRPGPADVYCNRAPSRTPGTYTTPAAPPTVGAKTTTWMSYACMAVESDPAGCGSSDPTKSVTATSSTLVVEAK